MKPLDEIANLEYPIGGAMKHRSKFGHLTCAEPVVKPTQRWVGFFIQKKGKRYKWLLPKSESRRFQDEKEDL
jgi:hypothetical protein